MTLRDAWHLPASAFHLSMAEMARDGAFGNEGIALWFGRRGDGRRTITHVVGLRGPGIQRHPNLLVLSDRLMNEVTDFALAANVKLIGQIHSHPGTFVDLSLPDREHGIKVPSYLSVVAPYYALRPDIRIDDCGVHVFEAQHGYRRLRSDEVARQLQIVTAIEASFVEIGSQTR